MFRFIEPIFKTVNLITGTIIFFSSLHQLTFLLVPNFKAFFLGIYALFLSLPILILEFKPIPNLHKIASFYYSFGGRGILYVILSFMVSFGGFFKIFGSLVVFITGMGLLICQLAPDLEPPRLWRHYDPDWVLNEGADDTAQYERSISNNNYFNDDDIADPRHGQDFFDDFDDDAQNLDLDAEDNDLEAAAATTTEQQQTAPPA